MEEHSAASITVLDINEDGGKEETHLLIPIRKVGNAWVGEVLASTLRAVTVNVE